MPINYKEYHPKWRLISKLIRVNRAKNRCECCGIPNKVIVKRLPDGGYRFLTAMEWDLINSRIKYQKSNLSECLKHFKFTKIVLTVAHLDHNKENNRFYNLKALCQKCHLQHDFKQHKDNRKYGRNRKGNHQLKLFEN